MGAKISEYETDSVSMVSLNYFGRACRMRTYFSKVCAATTTILRDHPHVMFRQPDGSIVGHGDGGSFSRSTIHSQHQPGSFVEFPLGSRACHAPAAQSSASLHGSEMTLHEPQMSAFLTVMSLIFVTIVRAAAVSLI